MDKYYNIAGFLICITGEKSETVNCVRAFEPFRVKAGKPYFTLHLVCNAGQEMPTEGESVQLCDFESRRVWSRFVRHFDNSCLLTMTLPEESESLLLHYSPGSRKCMLAGLLEPDLLRLALCMAFGMLTAGQAFSIQASVAIIDGQAVVLFDAPDGREGLHGSLWEKHVPGAMLLNDDSFIIRMDGSVPYICGSPWSSGVSNMGNERFPLAGFVRLSQASGHRMRRLWMLEAISVLLPSCSPVFTKDEELSRQICDTLSEVLACTPVWHLERQLDKAAVRLLYETLFHPIEG